MLNIFTILAAILILGICVVIHEFGHYIVGRKSGIGVVEFAVGMGPKIFGWERKGIKYSLRAIPLGGYCAFVGEDENSDDPRAMNRQPVWKRFLTVLAGPFLNLFLAFVLMVLLLCRGQIVDPDSVGFFPVLSGVEAEMPAGRAGLHEGDIITHVNGEAVSYDEAGVEFLRARIAGADENQPVALSVNRNGEQLDFSVTPEYSRENQKMLLGITFSYAMEAYNPTFAEAIPQAFRVMGDTVVQTVDVLKNIVTGIFRGTGVRDDAVMGPVGIVTEVSAGLQTSFGYAFSDGVYTVLFFLMAISLSLGIMNLLPIPALDGGRILFLLVEAIRRKPLNREKEALVNLAGFAFLILLIIVITVSDVRSLIR